MYGRHSHSKTSRNLYVWKSGMESKWLSLDVTLFWGSIKQSCNSKLTVTSLTWPSGSRLNLRCLKNLITWSGTVVLFLTKSRESEIRLGEGWGSRKVIDSRNTCGHTYGIRRVSIGKLYRRETGGGSGSLHRLSDQSVTLLPQSGLHPDLGELIP